jgi:6-phosphogluconolactonase
LDFIVVIRLEYSLARADFMLLPATSTRPSFLNLVRRRAQVVGMEGGRGGAVIGMVVMFAVMMGNGPVAWGDEEGSQWVFVGTYTQGTGSEGIYVFRLDNATGELHKVGVAKGVDNPSFLAVHPSGDYLYAVGETGEFRGRRGGAVAAFALDRESGELSFLNDQSSEGGGPCHIVVDATGKAVLVANYGGGSVASLPIGEGGRLEPAATKVQHEGGSVDPRRQAGPHAHSINVDPDNRFAFAADLGLDKILVYQLDAERAELKAHDPPFAMVAPGSGPRHFAFHPSGKFAYVINEMTCTMTAFAYDSEQGTLTEVQTLSTLPGEVEAGFSTAEVQVHPSGKFVYGSNRGHDSIAVFRVDEQTGKLTAAGHVSTQGRTPRNFGIDRTGRFLLAANQGTGTIVTFQIDQETGDLTPVGEVVEVPAPVCVKFLERN